MLRTLPAAPPLALLVLLATAPSCALNTPPPGPPPAPAPPPRAAAAAAPAASALATPSAPDLEPYREAVERIVAGALEQGRSFALLQELCEVAPERLAGSEGYARAAEWARAAMVEAGLENVRLEPVEVPRWERGGTARLRVVGAGAGGEELAICALGGSVPTPAEGLEAGVVEVRDFEELARLGGAVRGKLVFFNRPMDPALVNTFQAYGGAVDQRSRGAQQAAQQGAVGAIVRSMTTALDDHPHTGATNYAEGVERVPAVAISTAGAERLSDLLLAQPDVRLRLELDCVWHEPATDHNVVGELPGRERPEELLVVGGHLDAWELGVGAHDDGAGCVQSIEAAALLKRLGLVPRRTIRVVLFANEENGLRGGRAYHEAHLDEMPRHVLALESDRGGFVPRGFTTDANPQAFEVLRAASGLLAPAGADTLLRGGGGADIGPMAASGVVLAGLFPDPQRYFDVHHAATDTLERVNPRELELGTAAMAALLYVVAELPEPLPRNTPRD